MLGLIHQIDQWWINNVELAIQDDFDPDGNGAQNWT